MRTKLILVLFAVIVFSTVATAQRGQFKRQNMDPEKRPMMANRLNEGHQRMDNFFTEEQKEAVKELRVETAKKVKPIKNELQELVAHQRTLTTAENANMDAINKNIDKMAELKAEIAKIQAKQHQEIRALLTEEQLLIFDTMKGRKEKGHGDNFRNKRPGRG